MRALETAGMSQRPCVSFLKACKQAAQELLPGAVVILFGSQARGQATADSDYDLLVLTDSAETPDRKQRLRDALYEVALRHDAVVSVFLYSRRRWESAPWRAMPLHQAVEAEGILI